MAKDIKPATQNDGKNSKVKSIKSVYVSTAIVALIFVGVIIVLSMAGRELLSHISPSAKSMGVPEYVDVQLISVDGHARRGAQLESVKSIVVHYVGNPGTSAQANRNYFNSRGTTVSSHFVIGLEGEVILCVPLDEKSSASNDRNRDSISIEVCHEDETGKFNDSSYAALVRLTAWLCEKYELDPKTDVIRHYDVTGKLCPLYYVEHEDAWLDFLDAVDTYNE